MNRCRHIRRALFAAFTTAALLVTGMAGTASAAQEVVSERVCDVDWRESTWHVKKLIKCAARRWDSPGAPVLAVAVARCESELDTDAYNPNGYAGLYQQSTEHWPDRAHYWGQPGRSVFNGRANIIVSVRMAAANGSWSAWGGCG